MTSENHPPFWAVARAFAVTDSLIMWRMRTPLAFMFVVPAVLSVTLGPAVAGSGPQAVPGRSMVGVAVMFSFMTVNYAGLAFFREYTSHTWARQAVSRPSRAAFLVGKLLPVAGAGALQLTVFWAVAFGAYGLPLHGSVAQLVVVGAALVLAGCALGVVLYAVTRTSPDFQSVAYVLLLTSGSVGGTIVPDENLPALSHALGLITPQHWAMRALDEATTGGGSWGPTLEALLLIGLLTVVLGAVGLGSLDYRREKSALT
ncbi:ABC transporter permease [Kineosporia sp. J2-2]|uniref:ABC transporter permease n=1 Tax=Kineosporia corallincola TaxID=2835133 RepID=A0ABS5TG29_9ACTN|nr:ABC transporter permease [Kineosporia corallincola]MBT0770044.1 ABC transporter permease [Kineosporia corallincola]